MINLINYYLSFFLPKSKNEKLNFFKLLIVTSFIILMTSPYLGFAQVTTSSQKDPLDTEVPENYNLSSDENSAANVLKKAGLSAKKNEISRSKNFNNLEDDQPTSPNLKNPNLQDLGNASDPNTEQSNNLNLSSDSQFSSNSEKINQNRPKISLNYLKNTRSYIGDINSQERDPFRKSIEVLQFEEEQSRPARLNDPKLNDKIEAIRRWALSEYKIVGIIWDVRSPKVMIMDPDKTIHLLKRNYRIGDRDGIITAINEGSITVLQEDVPMTLDLTSSK